jgi:hypothetical protein
MVGSGRSLRRLGIVHLGAAVVFVVLMVLAGAARANLQSTVTATPTHIADGIDAATVTVMLYDADKGVVAGLGSGDFSVKVTGTATCGSVRETATAGTYAFEVTNTAAETVIVMVTAASVKLEDEPQIAFQAGPPDTDGSTVAATSPHRADGFDAAIVTVTLVDSHGNAVTGLSDGDLSIGMTGSASIGDTRETASPGVYELQLTSIVAGTVTVAVMQAGVALPGRASVEFVTPSVDERLVQGRFIDITRDFLFRRMDRLLTLEPRFHRLAHRLGRLGHGWGLALNGKVTVDTVESGFVASLRGLHRSISALAAQMEPGAPGTTTPPPRTKQPSVVGLDVWAEGQFSLYKDTAANGDRRGSFGILYAGADYCFGQRLLLGFMAQLDWTDETSPAIDSEVSGDGWMVGPYASVKLANALQLDLRGAWGRSSNRAESTVPGEASRFVGDFDSERWLVRGTLSGTWKLVKLRLTPEISLAYLQERQDGYTVTDGIDSIAIDAQRLSIGRFSLKPEFAYPLIVGETVLLPYARPQLLWDFQRTGELDLDGEVVAQDSLRGATEVGLRAAWGKGFAGGFSVSYDGIGQEDFQAVAVAVGLSFSF